MWDTQGHPAYFSDHPNFVAGRPLKIQNINNTRYKTLQAADNKINSSKITKPTNTTPQQH